MSLEILVKYHSEASKIEQIDVGDYIDLKIAEDVSLKSGEFKLISLGVSMKLPEGYYAEVCPRSSTFKKYGILQANSVGVIDNSYCGDNDIWMFPAYATRDVSIPAGTRICQFKIEKVQPKVTFCEVDTLGGIDRGGFGSTGD